MRQTFAVANGHVVPGTSDAADSKCGKWRGAAAVGVRAVGVPSRRPGAVGAVPERPI